MSARVTNSQIAEQLEEAGKLLETQGANPFRAGAYKRAAATIRTLPRDVGTIISEQGVEALQSLPAIGESLARSLERIIATGRFSLLDRLRAQDEPTTVLATISGIGPTLARRLKDEAGVSTLPELEKALSTGKLERLPGFGQKRIRAIRESLFGRLHRAEAEETSDSSFTMRSHVPANEPAVPDILDIDAEYREKARGRHLPRITPARFNPTKEAWLPVLKTERNGASYTAMYSNTRRAHELNATRDWVIVRRAERDGDGQWTVITSQYGALRGRRVIRGREHECSDYYKRSARGEAA